MNAQMVGWMDRWTDDLIGEWVDGQNACIDGYR